MKGAYSKKPPLPKYTTTWPVQKVLLHLKSFGPNGALSLHKLTLRLAALLALMIASRLFDLVLIDINYCIFTAKGIRYTLAGISKQSRPGHSQAPLEIASFSDLLLHPVLCIKRYLEVTREFHTTSDAGTQPAQL